MNNQQQILLSLLFVLVPIGYFMVVQGQDDDKQSLDQKLLDLQKQQATIQSQLDIAAEFKKHPECDPTGPYLTAFNCGTITSDGNKKTREFTLIIKENTIKNITDKGQQFIGWSYNGTIPGPTMRMTEGDNVKITVINDGKNNLSHSLHMHSIHAGTMDGVSGEGGSIAPGQSFTYSFVAQPAGVYPYHCHVNPVADHISRGLYGMMIIDPKEPRPKMNEMVMLMNGYDLNYEQEGAVEIPDVNKTDPTKFISEEDVGGGKGEGEERDNEIYTVNGEAFQYMNNPINLKIGEDYRIYLVNMLEFDLINSFHMHGMMFKYTPSGTDKSSTFINDIVTLGEGDRGILEFTPTEPGQFMFHAHQAEFTDLGWMGMFNIS